MKKFIVYIVNSDESKSPIGEFPSEAAAMEFIGTQEVGLVLSLEEHTASNSRVIF